jgi:hypothetical protein
VTSPEPKPPPPPGRPRKEHGPRTKASRRKAEDEQKECCFLEIIFSNTWRRAADCEGKGSEAGVTSMIHRVVTSIGQEGARGR